MCWKLCIEKKRPGHSYDMLHIKGIPKWFNQNKVIMGYKKQIHHRCWIHDAKKKKKKKWKKMS